MDPMRLMVRLALWLRRPPPLHLVLLAGAIVALGLAVFAIEQAGLWPSALTADPPRFRPPRR